MKLDDIVNEIRAEIAKKDSLNFHLADERVLSYISVYRHGAEPYREYAKQWLIQFAVNAGFVKNKKEVVDDSEV